jgi:hypothetical protein
MLYNYTATELQPTVSATLNTLDPIYEITIEGEMREKSFISPTQFPIKNLRKRRQSSAIISLLPVYLSLQATNPVLG